ncbi:hypothetical protein CL630_02415 [bacterium]|nr:hypothetical protein [bacterium]|tara:strand:- start:1297 stop:1584 length:288 start_codon:yes stop_codon:yes gene_type:complete
MHYVDFVHLKASDLNHIRERAEENDVQQILDVFGEWLSVWKDGSWVDHEKIFFNVTDLKHAGVWSIVSLADFVDSIKDKVCSEVLSRLEEIRDKE